MRRNGNTYEPNPAPRRAQVKPLVKMAIAVFATLFANRITSTTVAADDAVTSQLKMIAAELRANYERLSTWSGVYALKDQNRRTSIHVANLAAAPGAPDSMVERQGDLWETRHVLVRFAVDFNNDKLFTTYEVVGDTEVVDRDSQNKSTFEEVFNERHLVTGEEWVKANPVPDDPDLKTRLARGEGITSAIRNLPGQSRQYMTYSTVVDPRTFFDQTEQKTFAAVLEMIVGHLESGKSLPIQVTSNSAPSGESLVVRQELRLGTNTAEAPMVLETTYASWVGYNPIHMLHTFPSGAKETERSWDYREISGILIPSYFTLTKYDEKRSNTVRLAREFRLIDCAVNEPLTADQFEVKRLGLMEGDEMRDDIRQETLRVRGDALVPDFTYKRDEMAGRHLRNPRNRFISFLLVANAVLVVALAVIFAVRKLR